MRVLLQHSVYAHPTLKEGNFFPSIIYIIVMSVRRLRGKEKSRAYPVWMQSEERHLVFKFCLSGGYFLSFLCCSLHSHCIQVRVLTD